MDLLLLSLGSSAVPAFLAQTAPVSGRRHRVGYIGDAARGMPFAGVERQGMVDLGLDVVDIVARQTPAADLEAALAGVDAVYVAGGETFVLMEALRAHGAHRVLTASVRAGLPYIGLSAGSIVAGPSITPAQELDDRAAAPALATDEGLGLIEDVVIPHADGRIPGYPKELMDRVLRQYGDRFPLRALRDDQALRVSGSGTEVIPSP